MCSTKSCSSNCLCFQRCTSLKVVHFELLLFPMVYKLDKSCTPGKSLFLGSRIFFMILSVNELGESCTPKKRFSEPDLCTIGIPMHDLFNLCTTCFQWYTSLQVADFDLFMFPVVHKLDKSCTPEKQFSGQPDLLHDPFGARVGQVVHVQKIPFPDECTS